MLDKQSVLTQDAYQKAWVKVEYKTAQKNPDSVDKEYTLSKALWFFDCKLQKTATTQVFQFINQELVYSAAVDLKNAEFIEPQPDSDVETAMHYVCKASENRSSSRSNPTQAPATATPTPAVGKSEAQTNPASNAAGAEKGADKPAEKPMVEVAKPEKTIPAEKSNLKKATSGKTAEWSYAGKTGPDQWAKLDPVYSTCASGLNQSPVALDSTIHAALKPIRTIHKFAAKEIQNTGQGIRIQFKEGNMMVLDKSAFQLKYMDLHAPSEHQINGQSYPLELQLHHLDNKNNVAILSILFKAGDPNEAAEKLLANLPKSVGETAVLKGRMTPADWMPTNPQYYRYTGSLSAPPCTEGVRWIIMKSPKQATPEQLKAIIDVIGKPNNRPVQALNGRTVLE